MGFLSGFSGASQGASLAKDAGYSAPSSGMLPILGSTPSAAGLNISQATSMAVSAVYACVTIRSQDFARCTPRLYKRRKDGSRDEVTDHPVAELLHRPNSQQTWYEFAEQMAAAKMLRGNAPAPCLRDTRGRPTELIPVNPDAVQVLEGSEGGIYYSTARIGLWQMAKLRQFPTTLNQEDMFHWRGLSFNSLVGLSTIGLARDSIGVAMGLEQQAARWMANASRPSGLLLSKKRLDEPTAKRLKQQFTEITSGIGATGSTPILEEGLDWKQMGLTSVDAEFVAQRNFQAGDVARFFRVPPHKLGMELMRGINVVQVDQDYVNNTVMPDLHSFEQKFDQYFGLWEQGLEIDLDETVLLRADVATRYNAARIGLLSGFLSPNEVRAGEGLPPVEGGDEVFRPLNMAALGSDATGTAPDGAGRPGQNELPADSTDGVAEADDKKSIDLLTRALSKAVVMRPRYPRS